MWDNAQRATSLVDAGEEDGDADRLRQRVTTRRHNERVVRVGLRMVLLTRSQLIAVLGVWR